MTQQPAPTIASVLKYGIGLTLSRESLLMELMTSNPELERRHIIRSTAPTEDAWERYRAAVAGKAAMEAYEGTEWGGPDYGTEVNKPEPTRERVYTETEEAHAARLKAAGFPTSVTYTRGN